MKWFDKWFAKKCKQAWEDSRADVQIKESAGQLVAARSIDSHGMNFTVYRANGGHIIETRKYDKRHDSNNHSLHIVTDDKDLGEEIGKIITFENLRS
jgi:hypothetical protein